jgi:hypothetical protein
VESSRKRNQTVGGPARRLRSLQQPLTSKAHEDHPRFPSCLVGVAVLRPWRWEQGCDVVEQSTLRAGRKCGLVESTSGLAECCSILTGSYLTAAARRVSSRVRNVAIEVHVAGRHHAASCTVLGNAVGSSKKKIGIEMC